MTDSKEHIKHLRSVHFTLVITCAAILVVFSFRQRENAEVARDELHEIQSILSVWNNNDPWLFDFAKSTFERYDPKIPASLYQKWQITTARKSAPTAQREFLLTFEEPFWTIQPADLPFSPSDGVPVGLERPATLSGFRELWDRLEHLQIHYPSFADSNSLHALASHYTSDGHGLDPRRAAVIAADAVLATSENGDQLTLRLDAASKHTQSILAEFSNLRHNTHVFTDRESEWESFADRVAKWEIFVPLPVQSIRFSGQRALSAAFSQRTATWKLGPFSESFHNLDSLTEHYQDLPIDRAALILNDEANRSGDRFEMFGIKVPILAVTTYGIPAILIAQGYLLLHLTVLSKLTNANDAKAIPWIGIYEGRLPRYATIASSALLPAVTVAVMAITSAFDLSRPGPWILAILGAVLSGTLSVLTYKTLQELHTRIVS